MNCIKPIASIIFTFIFFGYTHAQAPDWAWANFLPPGPGYYGPVFTDKNGNAYITGNFSGPLTLGTTTLNVAGDFIIKLAPTGDAVWATSFSSMVDYSSLHIVVDANGSLYMAGAYANDTVSFGDTTLINTSPGSNDICIVKFDSSGNFIWAKNAGGNNNDQPSGIALDVYGGIYVTGGFYSNSLVIGGTTLTNAGAAGSMNMFLVKLNASGNVVWAKGAAGNNNASAISANANGYVYVAGDFTSDSISFGNTTLLLSATAANDGFLVKYDSSGIAVWAKNLAEDSMGYISGMSADAQGNIYVADNLKVVEYNSLGNVNWIKTPGGTDIIVDALSTDATGNIYLFGIGTSFGNNFTFAGTTLNNSPLFVAKLDSSGQAVWVQGAVGEGSLNNGFYLSIDATDNIYISNNDFTRGLAFGSDSFPDSGNGSSFVAKLGNNTAGITNLNTSLDGVTIYPNPTMSYVDVVLDNTTRQPFNLSVIDITGRMLYTTEMKEQHNRIDISSFAQGLYLFKMMYQDGSLVTVKKVVKE